MTIHIENLEFQCIIGILDFERVNEQDIIINCEITYDYVDEFINYAEVTELIKNKMILEKFLLIEDALTNLSANLKRNFPLINSLNLKITKPSILSDVQVSVSDSYKF